MIDGICCVGSAHIDIIARQNGTHGIDQTGEVSVSVGGTAYNVVCNLRHFGVNVALVTVIKDSIFGNIVLDKLKSYGIVTDWVIEDSGIPESVFIAVHGSDRLITAVNNLSVDKFHITNFPRANAYFVDLNNSVETLRSILARQKPVYIGLVSEEKAVKLATLLEIESPSCIQCVSGNESEYAALLKVLNLASPEELSDCYPNIEFIYTMHEKGLKVFKMGRLVHEAQGIDASKVPYIKGSKHIMGTGDAFIAGYIYAREIKSMEVSDAVDYAMANAVLLKLVTPGANLMEDSVLKNFSDVLYVDQLTKAYNRHYFEKRKSKINSDYVVIMIDIDRFKSINDTYGHKAGDVVLKEVACLLKKNIRQDDMLLRWGGEEFAIFFKGNLDDAVILAERLRYLIESTPIDTGEHLINVTASFGISSLKPNESVHEAIIKADRMLYKAKNTGRNKVVYA